MFYTSQFDHHRNMCKSKARPAKFETFLKQFLFVWNGFYVWTPMRNKYLSSSFSSICLTTYFSPVSPLSILLKLFIISNWLIMLAQVNKCLSSTRLWRGQTATQASNFNCFSSKACLLHWF